MAKDPVLGAYSTVGIGIEHIEGTPVAADLWFDITADGSSSETTLLETEGLGACVSGVMSREDQAAAAVPAKEDNRVGFSFQPRFNHLARILGLTLGGQRAGLTYEPGATPASFTQESDKVAEFSSGKSVEQYAGGKVTKLTIKSEANKALVMTIEGVGRTCTVIAGTAPDYSAWASKSPMMHHGLSIQAGPSEIPVGQVFDIEVEIATGVAEDHFANSLSRICAEPGPLTVTGTLTVPFNDETAPMRTKIKAGTRFDLRCRWAGDGAETFDLYLSLKALGDIPKITTRDGQKLPLKFKGFQSGGTHAIKGVLGS